MPAGISAETTRLLPDPVAPELTNAVPETAELQLTFFTLAGTTSVMATFSAFEVPVLAIVTV
ncbi:hypothetical protein D3C85_1814460 [compost metagenome]